MKFFRAKAFPSVSRKGWCVLFQHPFQTDKNGQKYPIVKRYLCDEQEEVDVLVEELNELLRIEEYWTSTVKGRAKARYDQRVVNAFYDEVDEPDTPTVNKSPDAYQISLIGEAQSGKTSIVRAVFGIHPAREKFPIRFRKANYDAVYEMTHSAAYEARVSFQSRQEVYENLEKSLIESALVYANGGTDYDLAFALVHGNPELHFEALFGEVPYGPRYFTEQASTAKSTKRVFQYVESIKSIASAVLEESKEVTEDFEQLFLQKAECRQLIETLLTCIERSFKEKCDFTWSYGIDDWPQFAFISTESRAHYFTALHRLTTEAEKADGASCYPLITSIHATIPSVKEQLIVIQDSRRGTSLYDQVKEADHIIYTHDASREIKIDTLKHLIAYGYGNKLQLLFTHAERLQGERYAEERAKKHRLSAAIQGCIQREEQVVATQLSYYLTAADVDLVSNLNRSDEDDHKLSEMVYVNQARTAQTQVGAELNPIYLSILAPPIITQAINHLHSSLPDDSDKTFHEELTSQLATALYYGFVTQPSGWSTSYHSATDRQRTFQAVATSLFSAVQAYVSDEVTSKDMKEWIAVQRTKGEEWGYYVKRFLQTKMNKEFERGLYYVVKHAVESHGGIFIH
jgi:hypothetical protein